MTRDGVASPSDIGGSCRIASCAIPAAPAWPSMLTTESRCEPLADPLGAMPAPPAAPATPPRPPRTEGDTRYDRSDLRITAGDRSVTPAIAHTNRGTPSRRPTAPNATRFRPDPPVTTAGRPTRPTRPTSPSKSSPGPIWTRRLRRSKAPRRTRSPTRASTPIPSTATR